MRSALKPNTLQKQYAKKRALTNETANALDELIAVNEAGNASFTFAELYAELKYRAEYYTEMLKSERLKDLVIEEIEASDQTTRDGGKMLSIRGTFELSKSSTGDRYDYSHDEVWAGFAEKEADLIKKMKDVAELRKEREAFLKVLAKQEYSSVNGKTAVVDETTGEQVKGARLVTPAKPIVRVKF